MNTRERRRISVLLSVLLILFVVTSFALVSQINIMADAVTCLLYKFDPAEE